MLLSNPVKDFKITGKLFVMSMSALVCLLAGGTVGSVAVHYIENNSQNTYQNRTLPVEWLEQVQKNIQHNEADVLILMGTKDKQIMDQQQTDIKNVSQQDNQLLSKLSAKTSDSYERQDLEHVKKLLSQYRNIRNQVIQFAYTTNGEEDFKFYFEKEVPIRQGMVAALNSLAQYNAKLETQQQATNQASYRTTLTWLILLTALGIFMQGALGLFISRGITRPIKALGDVVIRAEEGDLTVEGHYESKDEIGVLTRAFNSMISKFRALMTDISETSTTLGAASEELAASAEETAQATQQIATTVQDVAAGSDTQLKSIDGLRNSTTESARLIQSLADNAQHVSDNASQASELAENGAVILKKSTEQMDNINHTMGSISQVVEVLGERSAQIGQIVESITDVAAQTNLLSLNAAIEAARAGEHGRGFAVVAGEVRKLAVQSKEMADQISAFIGQIQNDIQDAVRSAKSGQQVVQSGIEVTREAGESFEGILEAVERVNEDIQDVFKITKTIADSRAVAISTMEIIAVAETNAQATQTASAATQEQMATMQEVAASANSLSQMAEQLQSLVSQFRV